MQEQIPSYGMWIIHFLVSGAAVFLTAKIVPGIRVQGFGSAVLAALAIGFANATIRWVLVFLTLPLTIITLGLFLFVVNAMVLRICAAFIRGFEISGWLSAIFGGIILGLISDCLHYFFI